MRFVYDFFFLIALAIGAPFFLLKMIVAGKYRRGIGQRLGSIPLPASDKPRIWLHAVSVGELQAAKSLVAKLQQEMPGYEIAISHTTRTGEEVAKQLYPELTRFYFPLDFSFIVRRVLKRLKPELVVLVELELWPNFLLALRARKTPLFLANGRISINSYRGYQRAAWALKKPFSAITCAAMQNDEYADRMRALFDSMQIDAERVHVAGNIKYDSITTGLDPHARSRYRELFGFGDDEIVLVCGSTHPGEHEELVVLYKKVREEGLKLRMVVVPRHPERWNGVRSLWRDAGVALVDRSSLGSGRMMAVDGGDGVAPCVLLDTMGELGAIYNAADIVFVGGTLIPHGGQNMAEPAALARAVLFGPHTDNFKTTVRDLLEARAAVQVPNWAELEKELIRFTHDPDLREAYGKRAQAVIEAGQGAVEKHAELIRELLKA